MILVDTSAWLDYFRGVASPISDFVDQALVKTEASVTGLIMTELLQGTRNIQEANLLDELFQQVTTYYESSSIWRKAGHWSLRLKKVGANIKTVDMVIAAMALEQQVSLLTKDSDFLLIAEHLPLKVIFL